MKSGIHSSSPTGSLAHCEACHFMGLQTRIDSIYIPGPSNSGKFLGVLGDPYDLPNSSGLATIWAKHIRIASFPVVHWPYKVNTPRSTCQRASEPHGMPKLRLFLICGSLRVFVGDLRKFAAVLRSKWARFFCTAQLWTAVACVDKISGCFKSNKPCKASFNLLKATSIAIVFFWSFRSFRFLRQTVLRFPEYPVKGGNYVFFFRRTKIQVYIYIYIWPWVKSPYPQQTCKSPLK